MESHLQEKLGECLHVENLHKLLFELSSPERINIMLELQKQELKLSHISHKLDTTITQTSRNLQRLSEAKVIQKAANNQYQLTPYGEIVLSLLPSLNFVSNHQNYFLKYDISPLPHEFIARIGELSQGEFSSDILKNIEYAENNLREADKFIWIQTDQILKNFIPIIAEKIKQPFDFRFISPEAVMPPDNKAPLPSTLKHVQKRVLPKVDVMVIVTDHAAGFCLPQKSGQIDYRNINGTATKFRKWCKDLFLYYWEKAKPVLPS